MPVVKDSREKKGLAMGTEHAKKEFLPWDGHSGERILRLQFEAGRPARRGEHRAWGMREFQSGTAAGGFIHGFWRLSRDGTAHLGK